MKTTDRQPTETDVIVWSDTRKARCCFVCEEAFVEGDQVYIAKNHAYVARHTTCARNPSGKPAPSTEEEHLEHARQKRKVSGSDKRQRTGGHGYSGGDGFKDLKRYD